MTRHTRTFGILLLSLTGAATSTPGLAQPARVRVSDIDTIALHPPAQRIACGTDSLQFDELRLPKGRGPFPVAIAPLTSLNAYATAARRKADGVGVFIAPGDGHFDVLAPSGASGQAVMTQDKALLGVPQ